MARIAAASVALASVTALAVAGVAERASVADSFTVLGHLHWLWFPAALLLEFASMAAFAIMLRRLLAAGGASMGIRPMLVTAYAANAVSVSVPLAGPALATAFTFRRFTRQGAALPLRQLLAGRTGRVADRVLATASASPPRSRSFAAYRPRTGRHHGANLRTTDTPARLGAHELVLLHGQPGSPADWQLVAGRLPAPLHAVATDRPGYGSSLASGGRARRERPRRARRPRLARDRARGAREALLWRGGAVGGKPGARPGRGGGPARERRPGVRDRLGQAARRTRCGSAVRAGGVAADAMDGSGPTGQDRPAAGPHAAAGRERQLAGLRPCRPRTPPALAYIPDRATRPAARARRAGARHRVGPGAGSGARRPQGRRGSLRNRPPPDSGPAGCSLPACRGRGS